MMKNLRFEEQKIIKDIRNLFRLNKVQNDAPVKDVRSLFRLKIEAKGIKDIVLANINNLFRV